MQLSGLTHIIIILHVISEGSRVGTLHVGMGLYWSSPTVLREKLHWKNLSYKQEMTSLQAEQQKQKIKSE